MTTTYTYNIFNTTNIANKIIQLEDRINVNFEILIPLNSVSFDALTNDVSIEFLSTLDNNELVVLGTLVQLIIEEKSLIDFHPNTRAIYSPRYPVLKSDNSNGYQIGDILINTDNNGMYICQSNTTDSAIWIQNINSSSTQIMKDKTFEDNTTTFHNKTDNTKVAKFILDNISNSTTRTWSIPDATSTMVGTDVSQTLTNKTLDSTTNTITADNLHTATTTIDISSASAPVNGQVLRATGSTSAVWETLNVQEEEVALADSDILLTMNNVLKRILTISPTTNRIITLPSASNAVSAITGVQVNDYIDFTIIHTNVNADDPYITVTVGLGGSSIGFMEVHPRTNNAGTHFNSGSSIFRMRFTSVTPTLEAYVVYRIS